MRLINISLWLAALVAVMSFTSCDPLSSVEYKITNITGDTVTVTFHKEIMSSSYQGYKLELSDSVTTRCTSDSAIVAILAPARCLTIGREWNGLYREELVVPAWRYIESIRIGEDELDSLAWSNESAWRLKTTGGGFGEGESRYYDLLLRDR